jgi:hypothetical protein
MATRILARIALRPRSLFFIAASAIAVQTMIGCSHHRTTYRPIYAAPAPVAAPPCSNCGPEAPLTPIEPGAAPSSAVPALPEPAGAEVRVPPLSGPAPVGGGPPSSAVPPPPEPPGARGARSNAGDAAETPPRSRIAEPDYYDSQQAPSGGNGRNSSQKPSSSSSNSGPSLLGPNGSPSARNSRLDNDEPTAALLQKPVRRASLTDRLRPFVDETSANEIAYPSKADRPWRFIVLHHSAAQEGCYDQIDREHRKVLGFDGCGYHFVIGNGTGSGDGQIEVAMRWNNQKQGVHCRNAKTHDADEYGIGICLVGDFDQQPPTPRQVAAAQALVAYLSQRYKITPSRVTTHAHLAATPTVCPGKYFPAKSVATAAIDAERQRTVRTTWTTLLDGSRPN